MEWVLAMQYLADNKKFWFRECSREWNCSKCQIGHEEIFEEIDRISQIADLENRPRCPTDWDECKEFNCGMDLYHAPYVCAMKKYAVSRTSRHNNCLDATKSVLCWSSVDSCPAFSQCHCDEIIDLASLRKPYLARAVSPDTDDRTTYWRSELNMCYYAHLRPRLILGVSRPSYS